MKREYDMSASSLQKRRDMSWDKRVKEFIKEANKHHSVSRISNKFFNRRAR